jgi:hypothetical protein
VITRIDVREVLARSVSDTQRDLVTRPTGRAVRTSIEQALEGRGESVVALDFSAIRLVDCSCADEVVGRLLERGLVVVLSGASEHHLETVETVLEKNGLALAVERAGSLTVLGVVPERARQVFERLARRGSAAAAELAAELAWPLDDARAVLDDLVSSHLALRTDDGYLAPMAT